MANIFSLYGSIFIDNEKANKSIDDTSKKGENAGSKMGSAFGNIAKGAATVGTAVVGAASVLGTAAMGMVTSVADTTGAISDSAKKVGTSAEEYQKWAYAAKLSGMESATLEKAMIKQQKAFSDAKDGSKSMSEAYSRLGVDISKFSNSGDAFNSVIAKLADMKDETQRNALANDIFGKSYAELAPLLAEGSSGIEGLKNEASELGGVMSNDAVAAGEEFGDTLDKIKTVGMGIFNQLGSSLMPIIKSFMDLIIANMPMIQGIIAQITPVLQQLFAQMLPPLFDLVQQLLPIIINLIMQIMPPLMQIISAVLPVITQLLTTLLPPIIQIVQMILPLLLQLITPLLPLLQPILALLQPLIDLLLMIITPLVELLNMILPPLITLITNVIGVALVPLQAAFEFLANVITTIVTAAFDVLKNIMETGKIVLDGLNQFITGVFAPAWSGAWDGIKNFFSGIWDGIKVIIDGVKNFFNGYIDFLQMVFTAAWTTVWEGIKGTFTAIWDSVTNIVETAKGVFNGLIDFVKNVFTGNWRGAWEAVKNIFSSIFDGMKNAFKIPINWIIDGINAFIKGLNKLKIPDWVPGVGGKSFSIGTIPRLRVGIDYVPYDDFPAILHKGESVLTASETKDREKQESVNSRANSGSPVSVKVDLNIDKFINQSDRDIKSLIDEIMVLIEVYLRRKGVVWA